ncbi:MAG: GAF domain-containing protein [Candidatus Angelobacter sp.]
MVVTDSAESGMEMRDLLSDPGFITRTARRRDLQQPFDAMRRITQVFSERPQDVLQELVNEAMTCCGADSAGISLEEPDEKGAMTFRWVAVAGSFAKYLQGRTPRNYSPCGTCLDLGRPQLYRLNKPYYDFLGIIAEPITDGMLIPWEAGNIRGTIWAVAHHSREAFEVHDYQLLKSLADFVAIILRQQASEEKARNSAKAEASLARAHSMAHRINNPLQSLTNTLFLASQGGPESQVFLQAALTELRTLSELVKQLLAQKYGDE